MTQLIGLSQYKRDNASTICLGAFDGFHKGHQALKAQAEYLVTFYPHPKSVIKNTSFQLLSTPSEQAYLNKKRIIIPFTKSLSKLSAFDFLNKIIKPTLNPKRIVIGYDFKFGANQSGNFQTLQSWGKENQCEIIEIPPQLSNDGTPYKSSKVKHELLHNFDHAIELLGIHI